jgi:2-amino-4-hydroxy-6-hydroxymethyldihydropteridine diphosphokinase
MASVYLGLGSNLGERLDHIRLASAHINGLIGRISTASGIYETEPWGYESKNAFLNQVIMVDSDLLPQQVMQAIGAIEQKMGRSGEAGKYTDRIIDIDLLFYDDHIIFTCALNIPHPRIAGRKFVLKPLAEIAADMIHPVLNKSISQLLAECEDNGRVELYHSMNMQ